MINILFCEANIDCINKLKIISIISLYLINEFENLPSEVKLIVF